MPNGVQQEKGFAEKKKKKKGGSGVL